jgi:prevent-host-death family protein
MCYMAEREHPDRVGVRELRQNLSVYLQRVKEGETLEITEHGRPVAELRPRSPARLSKIDQMIADGRITPARGRPRDLPPPPPPIDPTAPTLSEILQQMRDEERW